MRNEKSYNGELMTKGKENEEVLLHWLKTYGKSIIDFRDFRLAQRIDVDFGIETVDGNIILAEIKSDKWISEQGNLCFENHRINHFVKNKWFYLGWGWRSPAQKLIIRNPTNNEVFVFDLTELRAWIGNYIATNSKGIRFIAVETDNQKTTFNILFPMKLLAYKKWVINSR